MKAVSFTNYGDPSVVIDVPIPTLQPGEILVRMEFAAINPRDINLRNGMFRNNPQMRSPSPILGNEGVGTIVALAGSQQPYPIGTRVLFREAYRLRCGGTWQEYVVARPEDVIPVPDHKDSREAAALRTGYQSAWIALVIGGFAFNAEQSQSVLAPTIGGSVGNAAVQIAAAFGGNPFSTAGSTEKANQAAALGYTNIIDLSEEPLLEGMKRLLGEETGVDLALDPLGGPYTSQLLAALKPGKAMVVMGGTAGREVPFPLSQLIQEKKSVLPLNVLRESPECRQKALDSVLRLWTEGRVRPIVARTFHFTEAVAAQHYVTSARPFGKVLLAFGE